MAVYPPRGSSPWDITLKAYLDELGLDLSEEAIDTIVSDLAADSGSQTALALSATIAATRGETIRPSDSAAATDRDKLQAIVDYCIANDYKTIVLERWYDVTGEAAVSIDKVNWYDRDKIIFEGAGGGIIKHDAGFVFTSGTENTGDVTIKGVKFLSTPGVGATVFDGDKLIRLDTHKNEFRDWDHLITQTTVGRWIQSVRVLDDVVIGGSGAFVRCRESYDTTLRDCLVEDRDAKSEQAMFFENTDAALTGIANRNLRIIHNTVENCDRVPIKLAMTWSGSISLNYFESNGNATDPQVDLWTLANLTFQTGLLIQGNQLQQKSTQRASRVGAILVGANATGAPITSIGNVLDQGILYQFGNGSGLVQGSGDRVENGGMLTLPGQEHQHYTTGGKSTTTAGRPKNPRIGFDTYFDTDLGKLISARTGGVKAIALVRFTAGASTSGNITITIGGVVYTVAVTAGDTLTQVRDKVVAAAASTFYPTWKVVASSTNLAVFNAYQYGPIAPATVVFAAGGTGVTSDLAGIDTQGANPGWVETAAVVSAQATLNFPSIAAGTTEEMNVTVTPAAFGDALAIGAPSLPAGLLWNAFISAANTVKIRIANVTGSAIDPASLTWTVKVIR